MCNLSNSVFYDNVVIIVGVVIYSVFYEISVYVSLPFNWSPFIANVCSNVYDLERSKESIFYTFFQTICVYWLTKIADARLVFGFFGRSGHAKLDSSIKVFQYFTPITIIFRTSSMALVHNDHVKELWLKQFLVILFSSLPDELLIKGKVNFVCGDTTSQILLITDFMNGLIKRLKVLLYRLVNQNIAVGQIQNLIYQPSFQQTIDNLKCRVCLTCSSCHHKQKPILSLCNSIDCAVYCITLVISRWKNILSCAEWLVDDFLFFIRQTFASIAFCKKTCK